MRCYIYGVKKTITMKKTTIQLLAITLFVALACFADYSFGGCVPDVNYDGCETEVVYHYNYIGFQWYLNGQPIYGATDWFYEATSVGIYTCKTVSLDGCIGVSKRLKVTSWCGH
jgi:hypothetical protein